MEIAYSHPAYVVSDLERSIAFYAEIAGMRVVRRSESGGESFSRMSGLPARPVKMAYLEGGGRVLALQEFSPPNGETEGAPNALRATHLVFFCPDVAGAYAALTEKGVRFLGPPITTPAGNQAVMFLDPDGYVLELIEPLAMG
jgi:catechol 2,3-dioxygenase-like lactoylglutathione lyase family enzyme